METVLDGFPLGRAGREIYRDPVVISGVRLVKNFVERGSVVGRPIAASGRCNDCSRARRMPVLQVKSSSLALIGQFSIGR